MSALDLGAVRAPHDSEEPGHANDYHCRSRYREVGFPGSLRRCGWRGGPSSSAEAPICAGVLSEVAALPRWYRGLRVLASLVARTSGARPYRLIVRRDGDTVRLFTRRGHDWTDRYPAIASAAAKLRAKSFTMDGEAVVCGPDGVAVFDALHRRGRVTEAMLYAFDLLELDGEDLRGLPLVDRKKCLARLLVGRRLGIVLSDHTDDDGATIFRQACRMGLEGIVSKRL